MSLRVTGLRPGQRIEVVATTNDAEGRRWRSSATFIAGRTGVVDLARQSPLWGDYEKADAMGLFWSMRSTDGPAPFADPVASPGATTLEVRSDGSLIAGARVDRSAQGPGVERTEVRDEGLVGALFSPAVTPAPGVLVLADAADGVPERTAALLASRGFTALALAYVRARHLPATVSEIPLEYFERAIGWLLARRSVAGTRLALVGSSRGGELALLLGATFPSVGAVVAVVPSGVVHAGFGGSRPAWSYRGRPIPHLDPARHNDPEAVGEATIAVERTRGPILLVTAGDDQFWPSPDAAEAAIRRGGSEIVEHLAFPFAGHGIAPPFRPTQTGRATLGGTPQADAEAGEKSWRRILSFLTEAGPSL